jgi:hypothetical protein
MTVILIYRDNSMILKSNVTNVSLTIFWRNSNSYEYKNKSARRGAQFVPIGMPTTCWNSIPPEETDMLSYADDLLKQYPSKGDKYVITIIG